MTCLTIMFCPTFNFPECKSVIRIGELIKTLTTVTYNENIAHSKNSGVLFIKYELITLLN